jgi:predicted metalloprotease with PDZ domain
MQLISRGVPFFLVIAWMLSMSPVAKAQPSRPIELRVDATEAPRRLLHARLMIPAKPGPLTLHYPMWIQGEHQPAGPITELSGLVIKAEGQTLAWKRDDIDLHSFHVNVPVGVDAVDVDLDYLGPLAKEGYSAGPTMFAKMAIINWHLALVYPGGTAVRDLPIHAGITLPKGWKLGTALPIESTKGTTTLFETVSLEKLADSTVVCGEYLKEVPLDSGTGPQHFLVLACDSPEGLVLSPELKKAYENLVAEAGALFGARHYGSYRFLFSMSDQLRGNAIEHHECSDNRLPERFLIDDSYRKLWTAWVAAHEYTHSWNGKYRRPAGLATTDFQQPMKTDLLWVYEGLTEYLGFVLAARSGLYGPEISRDNFATIADWAGNQTGRSWRSLEDTATAAPHLYSARTEWSSRRRGVDFYDEGALLWLEIDTLIREKTAGKKSLDDFCRVFHGGKDSGPMVKPYTIQDVIKGLDEVVPYNWLSLLERRVRHTAPQPPLEGLRRAGWKLVYSKDPNDLTKASDGEEKSIDLRSSIGLLIKDDGSVIDVIPGKAADKAGVGPGMKLIAVDGRRFAGDRLREAVAGTTKTGKLRFLLENGDYFHETSLAYNQGARFPHLERIEGKPDVLSEIFRAKTGK